MSEVIKAGLRTWPEQLECLLKWYLAGDTTVRQLLEAAGNHFAEELRLRRERADRLRECLKTSAQTSNQLADALDAAKARIANRDARIKDLETEMSTAYARGYDAGKEMMLLNDSAERAMMGAREPYEVLGYREGVTQGEENATARMRKLLEELVRSI